MFCSKCGTQIVGNASFCSKCGAKIDQGMEGNSVNITSNTTAYNPIGESISSASDLAGAMNVKRPANIPQPAPIPLDSQGFVSAPKPIENVPNVENIDPDYSLEDTAPLPVFEEILESPENSNAEYTPAIENIPVAPVVEEAPVVPEIPVVEEAPVAPEAQAVEEAPIAPVIPVSPVIPTAPVVGDIPVVQPEFEDVSSFGSAYVAAPVETQEPTFKLDFNPDAPAQQSYNDYQPQSNPFTQPNQVIYNPNSQYVAPVNPNAYQGNTMTAVKPKKSKAGVIIASISAVVVIAVAIVGVFLYMNSQQGIAKRFLNAVAKGDAKTVYNCVPEGVFDDVDEVEAKIKKLDVDDIKVKSIKESNVRNDDKMALQFLYAFGDIEIEDVSKFDVECEITQDGETETEEIELYMIKVDGKWYVDALTFFDI